MTKIELIEALKNFPDEMQVVVMTESSTWNYSEELGYSEEITTCEEIYAETVEPWSMPLNQDCIKIS